MRFSSILLVGGSFLLLSTGTVSGNHHRKPLFVPRLCDADGESSEECSYNSTREEATLDKPTLMRGSESLEVRFFLHTNALKPEEYSEIFLNKPDSVKAANPFPMSETNEWKVIIPGFPVKGLSPFPANVIRAYMQRMRDVPEERYNVLVVDWDKGACFRDFDFENTTYTGAVGERVAEMLLFLEKEDFLKIRRNTHIVSFSMGSHVAGEAARFIFRKFNKKNLLERVTAIEPAGGSFWPYKVSKLPMEKMPRIRRSFVAYLDAIHTSKELGMGERKIGDIDFFPNGGEKQPGCRTGLPFFQTQKDRDYEQLCSHVYATELFARSINDKSMKGCVGYDYYDLYKKNKDKCEDYPIFGEFVDEITMEGGIPISVGQAFLETGTLDEFGTSFKKIMDNQAMSYNPKCIWCQLC